jgi:hypothetical protein
VNSPQGYINTCFEEANAAMTNTLVPIKLIHHGTKRYEGSEITHGRYGYGSGVDGLQMLLAFASGGSE